MSSSALANDTAVPSAVADRLSAPRPTRVLGPARFSVGAAAEHIANLWRYRDLLVTLTAHRIDVRYKQSALGITWAVLQPLALMLIYTVIFSRIARMPSDGAPYAVFAYSALLPWTAFSTALGTATTSLTSHSGLITKVYFPREILPISYIVAALVDFLIAGVVLALLLVFYRIPLGLNALYVVPVVAVMILFTLVVSLFLSALQARFRDVGVGLPLVIQIWMFATPIIYPLSAVLESKRVPEGAKVLYQLNPMVGIVDGFRRALLQNAPPDPRSLALSARVSLLLLPLAYAYFKRSEATLADVI